MCSIPLPLLFCNFFFILNIKHGLLNLVIINNKLNMKSLFTKKISYTGKVCH